MANNASCFQAVHTLNDIGIESKWSKTTPFWPTDIFIQGLCLDPPMRIYSNGYGTFELISQRRQRLLPKDRRIENLIIG